ncbi:SID1 transmembrane family member 1 isoform 2-T2 [Morphnus guianensis]
MASGGAPAPGALLCALLWAVAAAGDGPGGSPLPGAFGRVYRGTVNINAERVYAFAYSSEPGQVDAVRVYVNSSSENLQYPVLFVVRQQKGVLSWQVPLIFRGLYQRTYNYQEVSRTLCPSEPTPETGPSDQIIFVDVASMAPFNIAYELLVTRLENFQLETNKAFNFTASPSQPQYFLYKFPQDVDSVIIKVVSDAVYPCSVVSVQDIVCPVYDLDHNVEFNGVYQSMTKQAAITVQRKDFPGEQFFVVFVIKPEDYACGGSVPSSIHGNVNRTWNLQRTKNLQVTIVPSIKKSVYVQAMFFSFLSFLSFYLGSVVVAFVHYIRVRRKASAGRLSPEDGSGIMTSSHPITASTPEGSSYGAIGVPLSIRLVQEGPKDCQQKIQNLFLEHHHHCSVLCPASHPARHHLPDGSECDGQSGHLLLQLSVRPSPWGAECLQQHPQQCGPHAAGLSFPPHCVAQGHSPPSGHGDKRCLYPDTSFMYMIAGLCMLKLYQTRHPDINASAYSAYASFAVVICLAVLGVVFGKNDMWFWVIFSMIHVLASLALSTQIYYMGRFKIDLGIFRRAAMVLYTDCIQQCSRPMYMDRMVLLIVGNLVNWSFAIFGLLYRPRDFASYILGIFICNLLLYLAFYIIMKLRSSEKLLPIPMFCIVATAVVWAAALYFFFQNLSSWEETPAESREKNRPCILLGFFDDHDVWHFLSAAALFFSFLVSSAEPHPPCPSLSAWSCGCPGMPQKCPNSLLGSASRHPSQWDAPCQWDQESGFLLWLVAPCASWPQIPSGAVGHTAVVGKLRGCWYDQPSHGFVRTSEEGTLLPLTQAVGSLMWSLACSWTFCHFHKLTPMLLYLVLLFRPDGLCGGKGGGIPCDGVRA